MDTRHMEEFCSEKDHSRCDFYNCESGLNVVGP